VLSASYAWCLQGSGVRQVCDAIHRPAPGGVQVTLDHLALHVTLLNEYLVHVVAPSCLPGNCHEAAFFLPCFARCQSLYYLLNSS
jgi:hypothetical protein